MERGYSFNTTNPDKFCPGGKPIDMCETTGQLLNGTREFVETTKLLALGEKPRLNRLLYLSLGCVGCRLNCAVALEIIGNTPTGTILEFSGPGVLSGAKTSQDIGQDA